MKALTSGRALGYKALAVAFAAAGIAAVRPMPASADGPIACSSLALQSDGTSSVPAACGPQAHAALLELEYANQTLSNGGGGVASYPAATLRYGASNALELDASIGSYERARVGDVTAHAYADSTLGARYRVLGTGRIVVAALAAATLPTGSAAVTAGKPQYAMGLTGAYVLNRGLTVESSVAYATRYDTSLGTPQSFTQYQPSVALVTTPAFGTSFYVAGSGVTKYAAGAGPDYALGAGVRRQLGSSTMLDLGVKDGVTVVNGSRSHEIDVALSHLVR